MDLHDIRTWERYDVKGYIQHKLQAVKDLLPADVMTVLDAGCGNGVITNALDGELDILGLDISKAALAHVTSPKLLGSITALPFEANSFDLCMCHEVLEHLEAHDLPLAFAELKRCATNYIMISVPYREVLTATFVKCEDCGMVFHAYGHNHSFGQNDLDAQLAPAFTLKSSKVFGPKQAYVPAWLVRFKQERLGQWFHPTFPLSCPACNGQRFAHKRNWKTMAANAAAWIFSPRHPYWLIALYARNR
jgi:SAM-dependent methyltransferase